MLRLPTRRGQCLFCSLRASFVSFPKPSPDSGHAPFSSTSLFRERERKQNKKGFHGRPFKPPRQPQRRKEPLQDAPGPADLPTRVRASLVTLQKHLASAKADAHSPATLIDELDPQGTYWPAFKEKLEEIISSPGDRAFAAYDGLIHDIGVAQKGDWTTDLPRALHFGFIDYVLLRKAEDSPEKRSAFEELKFPTEWYTKARQLQRVVHLHIGPTNSGKTYNALKKLEESRNGIYAGPLRLLAHEVYSRFQANGIPCDLVTGDDVRLAEDPNTRLKASTVEMADISMRFEVAVIDEIQMMADPERGWAWTRAFLGANADEVHLCGEARVLPLIRELTANVGDILHVHEYKRLKPLKVMAKSLKGDLKNLRKGDCVVAFSVMTLHALKEQIELDTGRRCAIVYGGLPPETRAQQAALFNDPDNDYDILVASDAVGMGLNLSVKRIIFHKVSKFDGTRHSNLTVSQIKQIGGRAGRFRNAHQAMHSTSTASDPNFGLVTTLNEADLHVVRAAMQEEAAPIKRAGILPPGEALEEFESRLPKGVPFEYILRRVCAAAAMHERFRVCNIDDQCSIARTIESIRGLSLSERVAMTAAPSPTQSSELEEVTKALATCVAERKPVTCIDIPEIRLEVLEKPISSGRKYLQSLENLHKALVLYLWLSYRFLGVFKGREIATYAKEMLEQRINTCLAEVSANSEMRSRVLSHKTEVMPSVAQYQDTEGTSLSQVRTEHTTPADEESALNLADEEAGLPVDWSTGSESVGFDETAAGESAVAVNG